jgi:ArsR family transcriptional regulator
LFQGTCPTSIAITDRSATARACDESRGFRDPKSRAGTPLRESRNETLNNDAQTAAEKVGLDLEPYFCNYRNMAGRDQDNVARYADMFSAMGTEARLRIMQLLLQAHPEGLVVGEIQEELGIPNSTLSHHLDKLRNEDLVRVSRESTFLRYTANTEALQEVLQFLYAECCTRNKAVRPRDIVQIRT